MLLVQGDRSHNVVVCIDNDGSGIGAMMVKGEAITSGSSNIDVSCSGSRNGGGSGCGCSISEGGISNGGQQWQWSGNSVAAVAAPMLVALEKGRVERFLV